MVDNRQGFWHAIAIVVCLTLPACVTSVADDRPFNDVIADTEIKADVTKRLLDPANNDLFFDISSDTYEGRVMLTGSVKTLHDRERAAALVQGLRGVKVVYNEVQVTNKSGFNNTANDVWINTKLNTKYLAEVGIKSVNLRWRVINGAVYLLGLARSEKERNLMIALAKDTRYVTKVVDHIAVK